MELEGSRDNTSYVLSPEAAAEKLHSFGFPRETWGEHLQTRGLNHWMQAYLHIALGAEEMDIFEVFANLFKDDPLLDSRLAEMRDYLARDPDTQSEFHP